MRIGIISDLHAGLGRNDRSLRTLQTRAIQAAATYLNDADLQALVINGDITEHLANDLSGATSIDIAREQLAPIANLVHDHRGAMQTVCIAGNTDWPLASKDTTLRQVYFGATGLSPDEVEVPFGGLLHYEDAHPNTALMFTHGHACKPEFLEATERDDAKLLDAIDQPTPEFLERIASISGSHRMDYIKACALGLAIKPLPRFARERATSFIAGKFTRSYEQHVAGMLAVSARHMGKKALAVIGHTHVAGIRTYDGQTVLNTGTTGAKPNPLQRHVDPRGHVAVIDTEQSEVTLVQTYNASRPKTAPVSVDRKTFSQL